MVANNRLNSSSECLTELPDGQGFLLPLAVIYGKNGAGKSNLIKAINFGREFITNESVKDDLVSVQGFALSEDSSAKPSVFTYRFLMEGSIYEYGFSILQGLIEEEWLYLLKGNREKTIFERETSIEDGKTQVRVPKNKNDVFNSKTVSFANVFSKHNQLFLKSLVLNTSEKLGLCFEAYKWFDEELTTIFPESSFAELNNYILKNKEFKQLSSKFISHADTGITSLEVRHNKVALEQLPFSEDEMEKSINLAKVDELTPFATHDSGRRLLFKKLGDGNVDFYFEKITAQHKLGDKLLGDIELGEESDGTQRLLHLIPLLHRGDSESEIFVVDELDRSLHPLLLREFLNYFLSVCKANNSQLIFSTHDSLLMDIEGLRRDEVWFVEKNKLGETELYSLANFKLRKDVKLSKNYLSGRYGAIPFLGNIDTFIEAMEE
jgi:AAA15 family ATPase/GTPase